MKRMGQIIYVKDEGIEAYEKYHTNPMPGVNEMIKECNIQNYSIFRRGNIMFAYFAYTGVNYEEDMKKMAADSTTQKWWSLVHPLMQPLEGENDWADLKEIYHLD